MSDAQAGRAAECQEHPLRSLFWQRLTPSVICRREVPHVNVIIFSTRNGGDVVHEIADYLHAHGIDAFLDWSIDSSKFSDQLADMIAESQLVVILANREFFASAYHREEWEVASRSPTPKLVIRCDDVEIPQTNAGFTVRDCAMLTDAPELVLSHIKERRRVRLFVSYSREDGRHLRTLLHIVSMSLNQAWVDKSGLRHGEPFPEKILSAIERSDYFLLLWSHRSRQSRWVEKEWNHAFRLGKKIIPVLLDNTPLPMVLESTHAFTSLDDGTLYDFLQVPRARRYSRPGLLAGVWQRLWPRGNG